MTREQGDWAALGGLERLARGEQPPPLRVELRRTRRMFRLHIFLDLLILAVVLLIFWRQ